jgi:hypothetical protein
VAAPRGTEIGYRPLEMKFLRQLRCMSVETYPTIWVFDLDPEIA